MVSLLREDTYHRVDLLGEDSWSLFIAGPKGGSWYFWDRVRKARCGWRSYVDAVRDPLIECKWEPDAREAGP